MSKTNNDNEVFLKTLGGRITKIRKQKGITQVDLGYRCDIEKPNMNRLEKGKTNTTILTLRKICKELGIDLDELLKF
jgi:transcriptional regulator with XRE-family HTH domain